MTPEQLELIKKACDLATTNHRDIGLIARELQDLKARENNKVIAVPQAPTQTIKELKFEIDNQSLQASDFEIDFVKSHLLSLIQRFHIKRIEYK